MNANTNIIIITDSDHLVHMQSIPSVCPGAPMKKQNEKISSTNTNTNTNTNTTTEIDNKSKTVKKLF